MKNKYFICSRVSEFRRIVLWFSSWSNSSTNFFLSTTSCP